MKIVKKISIEKFRKMSKLEIPLDAHIVAIAGQNGTQKTSLLGMIAHPFSLKDTRDPMSKERDVYGCRFGSAIQDRFKFSSKFDKAGEHSWSVEIHPRAWSRERIKCVSARRMDVNEGWRFSDPSKKKGRGYFQCPTIYLSLKRLIPIGEMKISNAQLTLSSEEQKLFGQWHNEILICQDHVLGVRSVKGWAKKSAGVTTGNYDALTMSAGQDNVGEIILAVLSMRRLKNKFKKSYEGGIVFIDEIDATLYPAAQVKLIDKLLEWSHAFGIQFFFTTHSETLLKTCVRDKYRESVNVVFLHKPGSNVEIAINPTFDEMCSNLLVGIGDEERDAARVSVYSEDEVTVAYLDALLSDENKQHVEIIRGADISAGIYKVLFDKNVGEIRRNIIVLDGDMEDAQKGAIGTNRDKYYNFVCIPGDKYPEYQLFKFFANLSDDDAFWEHGLRGYNKQKCFREVMTNEKSKGKIKEWFAMQDRFRENGCQLLLRRWAESHPDECKKFNLNFERAYKLVQEMQP